MNFIGKLFNKKKKKNDKDGKENDHTEQKQDESDMNVDGWDSQFYPPCWFDSLYDNQMQLNCIMAYLNQTHIDIPKEIILLISKYCQFDVQFSYKTPNTIPKGTVRIANDGKSVFWPFRSKKIVSAKKSTQKKPKTGKDGNHDDSSDDSDSAQFSAIFGVYKSQHLSDSKGCAIANVWLLPNTGKYIFDLESISVGNTNWHPLFQTFGVVNQLFDLNHVNNINNSSNNNNNNNNNNNGNENVELKKLHFRDNQCSIYDDFAFYYKYKNGIKIESYNNSMTIGSMMCESNQAHKIQIVIDTSTEVKHGILQMNLWNRPYATLDDIFDICKTCQVKALLFAVWMQFAGGMNHTPQRNDQFGVRLVKYTREAPDV